MNRLKFRLVFAGLAAFVAAGAMACGGGGQDNVDATPTPDAPPNEGTLSLSWEITDGANALTCDQVAAARVSIRAIPTAGGSGFPEVVDCDQATGTNVTLPANTYNVTVTLITSTNGQLTTPLVFSNVEVKTGLNTSLGTASFEVVPQGNLEFTMDTNVDGPNCDPDASGGAGMTDIYIEFRNAQGNCVTTDFTVAAGAGQGTLTGTFSSDCAGTAFGGCIESDQTITVQGAPSGPNSMVFTGYKGATECFSRTSQFSVPGGNLTTSLIPQLLTREMIPACDPSL